MPLYKPRHPNQFPIAFHNLAGSAPGLYPLGDPQTRDQCLTLARRFRAFRMCLRVFTSHPLARAEVEKIFQTRVRPSTSQPGAFQLWVTIRPVKGDLFDATRGLFENDDSE